MKSGTTSKMNSRSDETMLVDQGVSSNGSRLAESATVSDATAEMMDMSRADDGANVGDTNDSAHASGSGVRRKLKLRDHKVRVTGVEKRYKLLLAYKKAECKRFVRDHIRRVHELYCLENMGGTILDAVDLLNLKEENKPRELLMLLEKYRLTDQVEPVAGPVDLESLQKLDVVEDSTSCPRIPTPETQIPSHLKPSPTKTATTPTTTATTPTKIATSTKKVTAPTEPTPRSATTVPLAATPAVIIAQSATVTTPRPSVTSVPLRATSQPPATSTPSPTASRNLATPTPSPVTLRIPTTTPTSSISAQPVIATKSAPAPPPKIVTVPTVTTPTPPRATTPVVTSATPSRAATPAATVLTPPRAATPTATMVTPPRATTPAATVLTPPRATTPAAAGSAATMSTAATSTAATNQNQSQDKSEPHSKSPEKSSSPRGPKKFSEKLKAEAAVVQRVAELQREGMWYDKRLPKAHDQPRLKSHWDYLLEEMQWLAVDFAVEKKWKRLAARKCARMVEKYFADKKLAEEKAKKDEKIKVQKIAAFMAKEIRNFWSNVRKLVEYKEQSKIEELRKKTMDQHLSFIVDQTEKISSMLAESFSTDVKPYCLPTESDAADSTLSSLKVFDDGLTNSLSDDEFLPSPESEDDEETIALAETEAKDVRREVDLLKKESEMPIDDILDNLPPSYVDIIIREGEFDEEMPRHLLVYDATGEADEYEPSGSESDLEDTILEEERMAATGASKDSATELKELEEDNLLSVEQLRAKYMKPQDSDNESTDVDNNTENDTEVNDSEDEESVFGDADETTSAEDQEHQSSLATLLQTFAPERAGEDHGDDELNSVAALAESFQPTGYTLSSTSVATKIPPLLKHILREYQHIGLDWLVTMYDKKLNGILADEMGLGKTIQTIALLAHLACEKGNWGPHLIIVPTSVMLNWEMEFLKWCPGFKVLTYYGSIKERKAKRTGWTKPNTFHVCITSYKILIQDHHAFRRKRWKYLILDEAQNIKNFKSQRWQLLLNFSTHRRLLLTGTPLQNNLMELWSLMHFLMPNVFQSHREFRQWFSNPMTGMIEGNSEYNENIIKRLHKVLRPFILRRLKSEVEKQLPQKYEHIVLCRLSKRQRYLYEDFMSRAKTKETLQSGSLLSVINVLMQLRKVCNHPNLFEPRPIISPLQTKGFPYLIPSLVYNMRDEEQENTVTYNIWNLTSNEECLDKQMAKKLRSLVSKNYRLTIRYVHGNPIMETIHFPTPKLESLRSIIDLSHSRPEDDIIIPIDGDEDCSIIFEHKSDPTLVRKKMYTFQKSVVPNPPRLKNPFPLFTVDTTPTDFLLEDKEFLAGLKQELSQQSLSLRPPSSSTLVRRDDWIEATLPSNAGRRSQRQPRVTKLSNSEYPMKLATTANGSDVILTTNGVCVVKPEPSQTTVATTVPYASFKTKRKRPTEVDVEERRSPLDAVVVDFEDSAAVEYGNAEVTSTVKASEKFEILSLAKSNGIEDEQGIDVLGGNGDDGEFGESPSKIPRLETPVRGRKRQSSESPLPRKGSRYTEDDDEESSPTKRRRATKAKSPKRRRIDLYNIELEEVVYRRLMDRQAVISNIKTINNRRLQVHTVYGADLLHQVQVVGVLGQLRYYKKPKRGTHWKVVYARPDVRDHESHGYFNLGYHEVMLAKRMKTSLDAFERNHPYHLWRMTQGLLDLTWTLSDATEFLEGILKRFIIYTPAVSAPRIQMRVFRPSVSPYAAIQSIEQELSTQLKRPLEPLRPMFTAMETQFPDPRLIQYDCGKLQVLDGLLRRLKAESHRVLIFTQMAKMLDVLEAFLNHHGYIYLRLDGATKIEQRQLLMEKFNTNKRIFCFILSTRSGGIGVNLTGADTVIFYDSDWNPTMDAQAQDRCHRIGQTRDVHIYRLVSEKTVEENILKKSNQKKLLGELAIEGGNFTTAYFKKNTIHDIFDVDEREGDAKKRMAEILETPVPSPVPTPGPSTQLTIKEEEDSSKRSATYILESALAAAEDDSDVLAARTVKAEAAAELAEFDEDIPLLDEEATEIEEPSHVDQEMEYIMSELSSVERYALAFMETTIDDWSKETFANAQREIEIQKLEWEQEQQQQLDNRANEQLFGDPVPLLTVEEQLEDMLTYPMLPQVTTKSSPPPPIEPPPKSKTVVKRKRRQTLTEIEPEVVKTGPVRSTRSTRRTIN